MHRIDDPTADPTANGPGRPGFTEGDPEISVPATNVRAAWLNSVQEELARACELLGPLDPGNNAQLRTLLESIQAQPNLLGLDNFWTGKNLFSSYIAVRDRIYLDDPAGLDEIVYATDGLGGPVPARREREVLLPSSIWSPMEQLSDVTGWSWNRGTSGGFTPQGTGWAKMAGGASHNLPAEFTIPTGAKLTRVRIGVIAAAGVTITITGGFREASNTSPDVTDYDALYPVQATGVSTILEIPFDTDVPSNPENWNSLLHTAWLNAVATGYATIKWTRARFLDPGPRNF